tara:strand:+ start:1092 stop:1424 length:333 start_codon:yes stop_codon:yes gene_type:complete
MFYIYEKSSTYIMGKMDKNGVVRPDHRKSYATMPAAKAALTKMTNWHRYHTINDMQNSPQFRYGIAEAGYFHKSLEKSVVKKNMMNGKEFVEKVNTPYYCSPSSETYWSM